MSVTSVRESARSETGVGLGLTAEKMKDCRWLSPHMMSKSSCGLFRNHHGLKSLSQIALIVSSWLNPCGDAALLVFAKYQFRSP